MFLFPAVAVLVLREASIFPAKAVQRQFREGLERDFSLGGTSGNAMACFGIALGLH